MGLGRGLNMLSPTPNTPTSAKGTPQPRSTRRASMGGATGAEIINSNSTIKVVCRFRPEKEGEALATAASGAPLTPGQSGILLDDERGTVEMLMDTYDRKAFTFDTLFSMKSSQLDVFSAVEPIVDSVMSGFNGTILAYGQTGSGKTYSMEGPSIWDTEAQGIIPRAVDRIFDSIAKADTNVQFQVQVQYYEIYCEKVRDLLNPTEDNLKLRETKADGFVVQDVTETYCTNRDDVLRLLELGKTYRQTAPTLMNAESSRSHSILSILVDQKDQHTGRQKRGRLFLVDLAGSEKVSKTGASGLRLEEAKNINSSLTALGMVITALTSDATTHVPYRNSKLTRLLTEALGGNSKTTLVVCCAPETAHLSETVSTLRFGERAKRIQNRAKVNEELSMDELKQLLLAARREIVQLKAAAAELGASGRLSPPPPALAATTTTTDEDEEVLRLGMRAAEALASAANSEELDRLSRELEEARSEAAELRARCAALEDEAEAERAAAAAGLERERQSGAEMQALRSTIDELEGRLLKATLEAKNLSPSAAAAGGGPGSGSEGSPRVAVNLDAALLLEEGTSPGPGPGPGTGPGPASNLPSASASASASQSEVDDQPSASRNTRRSSESSNTYLQQYANNELSVELRDLLEDEIKSLEANLASKDSEARTAQASAVNYADKYIRLRDDYEAHVQRLMMKLSREQQARIQAEDSLEDALQRLWSDEEERKNAGGFFSLFTGSSSARRDERRGLSARERSLARSLDIAQSRAFQLAAELEANKEAHSIVLDTKEGVMRSLVKQNSQVTTERDVLKKRVEELVALNDNLTSLLRSSATRKATVVRATSISGGNSNTISGGGGGGKPVVALEERK